VTYLDGRSPKRGRALSQEKNNIQGGSGTVSAGRAITEGGLLSVEKNF